MMKFKESDLLEKTIRKIYVFKGRIVNVRNDDAQLSNGKIVSREVVEHRGGVGILPITAQGEVLLVKQYRYPYEELLLEIPAGKLEPGETPFETGVRELQEETGMNAARYFDLGIDYPSPGYCNEKIHLYAADGLTEIGQRLDEGEFLNVLSVPLTEALTMIYNGELKDSKTVIALMKYHEMQQLGKLQPIVSETEAAE
jgi:ADP-ribose pyrophosphatase